ncbi:hypothetical protein LAZ67_1008320 [Cordylochernes scorpioides]|uniref:Mos1 transposase HTH domain-containing protein n=1 Tax=Cordylochernes scorpioides TaxID=51811 RepID=A0ABY6K1C5_9ARAC|nr:hypothetical protein LAZ67_1008320 [Cordylochernes scorpioides]
MATVPFQPAEVDHDAGEEGDLVDEAGHDGRGDVDTEVVDGRERGDCSHEEGHHVGQRGDGDGHSHVAETLLHPLFYGQLGVGLVPGGDEHEGVVHADPWWTHSVSMFVGLHSTHMFSSRAVIKLFFKCWSASQTKAELKEVHGDSAPSFKTIYYWMNEFKRGREST